MISFSTNAHRRVFPLRSSATFPICSRATHSRESMELRELPDDVLFNILRLILEVMDRRTDRSGPLLHLRRRSLTGTPQERPFEPTQRSRFNEITDEPQRWNFIIEGPIPAASTAPYSPAKSSLMRPANPPCKFRDDIDARPTISTSSDFSELPDWDYV